MIMQAVVIEVQWNRLLVLDLDTRQRVLVNTPDARFYQPGALLRIRYNGVMTNSIPPQISAQRITVLPPDGFIPPPPAPCPPNRCPPVVFPPVVFPPSGRPPFGRPPAPGPRPPQRPRPRR